MLGKYKIVRELGRGAMGVVYEAFDTLIERTVAIKTILKSSIQVNTGEDVFSRFRSEARAAGRLSHPKIVSIYEYGETDEMAYIVMEFVRGKELTEYFDHGMRMPLHDGLLIIMQLLDALDYLHSHGIVHRDIKPANILITSNAQIKIADFGIAKIDSSSQTHAGVVLGTPTYMAPEQFMGHDVDMRADLYAAGVILYLILTGVRPFVGSVITIMHQAVHREATPPSELNPGVTKEFDDVVKKAMAKLPEDRYQTALAFLKALKTAARTIPEMVPYGLDATIFKPHEAIEAEKTMLLPNRDSLIDPQREAEIERIRFEAQKLAAKKEQAEQHARAEQEAFALEKSRQVAAQREAQAQANAQAAAEAKRASEAAEKSDWMRKIAELKIEAEATRVADSRKREQEEEAHALRARELAISVSERANKIAEVVAQREAANEAERRMRMEAKRALREEVLRKKQDKLQLLSIRDVAENRAEAIAEADTDAEIRRQREAAELVLRNKEVAAAKVQLETANRLRKEVEERAAREQKRTGALMLVVGIFLVLLLIGIVFGLLPSSK